MHAEPSPPWDTSASCATHARPDTATPVTATDKTKAAHSQRDATAGHHDFGLIPIRERRPPCAYGERVLVFTDGVDFAGQQYFDIRAEELWETDPDAMTEVAAAASHWMWRPRPQGERTHVVETARLDALHAGLMALDQGDAVRALVALVDGMRQAPTP